MASEGRIGFDGESDLIVTVSFDEKATRKVSRGMLLDLLQGEKSKIEIRFRLRVKFSVRYDIAIDSTHYRKYRDQDRYYFNT